MDIVFDIDGTLANAEHRLHFIKDPDKAKDWENFLSDEQVAGDSAIPEIWEILYFMLAAGHRVIFITGRPEKQRQVTHDWLKNTECGIRNPAARVMHIRRQGPIIYMRRDGDRRPSHVVKGELLERARKDGFHPVMAFEDRKDDAAMWREKGLRCLQVAEGDY